MVWPLGRRRGVPDTTTELARPAVGDRVLYRTREGWVGGWPDGGWLEDTIQRRFDGGSVVVGVISITVVANREVEPVRQQGVGRVAEHGPDVGGVLLGGIEVGVVANLLPTQACRVSEEGGGRPVLRESEREARKAPESGDSTHRRPDHLDVSDVMEGSLPHGSVVLERCGRAEHGWSTIEIGDTVHVAANRCQDGARRQRSTVGRGRGYRRLW